MKYSNKITIQILLILCSTFLSNYIFAQTLANNIDSIVLNAFKYKNGPGGVF